MESSQRHFLVTSTGCAATRWLAATLNQHPDIVCSGGAGPLSDVMAYGTRPSAEQVERIATAILEPRGGGIPVSIDDMFEELEAHRPARFVGNVHRETVASLLDQIRQAPLKRSIQVANLIRHPIPRTETKYQNERFNHTASPKARILFDRQLQERLIQQEELVQAWTKQLGALDASEERRWFLGSLIDTIESAADFAWRSAPWHIPHFKIELLKKDRAYFRQLLLHLTSGHLTIEEAYLDRVFSPQNLNAERFRTDALAQRPPRSAEEQWQAWEDWQRKAFHVAMAVTRFHLPYVEQGYSFQFTNPPVLSPRSFGTRFPAPSSDIQAQLARIRAVVKPGQKTIAFYCPGKLFRKQFGRIPELLEQKGYGVLYLHGEKLGGEFESHPHSFHVWGDLVRRLDFVDVFAVPNIMDALPDSAIKILFQHNSFAEVSFSNRVDDGAPRDPYHALVQQHAHFKAFLPLFDFIVASTPMMVQFLREQFEFFGKMPKGIASNPPARTPDADGLLCGLHGKKLAMIQGILPCGYPPMDAMLRSVQASGRPEKVLTYAPTLLTGKKGWEDFASVRRQGLNILKALLEALPDYQIVFKPCETEDPKLLSQIQNTCATYPNFQVDRSGSDYHSLYARTSILISDFSSTAYTFAFATLRPVAFFSDNESQLPEAVASGSFCQNRSKIGDIAQTPSDLVDSIRRLLSALPAYQESIRALRESVLFHPGSSEERFVTTFESILNKRPCPSIEYFEWAPSDPLHQLGEQTGFLGATFPIRLPNSLNGFDLFFYDGHYHAFHQEALLAVDLMNVHPAQLDALRQRGQYVTTETLTSMETALSCSADTALQA